MSNCQKTFLILLLLTGLALRLGWGLSRPSDEGALIALPDQMEYLQTARNLLQGHGFTFVDERFEQPVFAYRMPGYPVFLAACGGKVIVIRIAQAVLDTSSALAMVLLARRFMPDRWALVAGALVAFNPYLVFFSASILSETLFAALLAWGMLLAASRSRWAYACGMLVLVASVYVRPGAIGLPVLIAVAAQLVRDIRTGSRSFWRVPAGMSMILLLAICLAPWAYRNHTRVSAWVVTTTNSGATLWDGFNPDADGSSNQSRLRMMPELRTMTEVQRDAYLGAVGKEWAMRHPRESFTLAGKKLARTWSPIPLSAEYGSKRVYVLVGVVFAVPLFVLTLLGVGVGAVSRSIKLYLLLPAIYFTVVHALTVGSLRYRIPADVPMSILAAAGAAEVARRLTTRRQDVVP